MKNTKRIIVFALAAILAASALIYFVSAQENDVVRPPLEDNFIISSGAYDLISGKILTDENGGVKDPGFAYSVDDYGGIKVASPVQTEGAVVATSSVTSKAKTALDGLTVTVRPEQFEFTKDRAGRSGVFSILWTPDEISGLDAVDHYDYTGTNGLRNTIQPTKGLAIVINNSYAKNDGTMTASNVMITLVDGDFRDACDERLGYRWSFTARNNYSQSVNCDRTGISKSYEEVDISNGLTVSVRADEKHGYIVSVNGKDYFSAGQIAYYPNNVADQYSEGSMTYAKNDIDLSSLSGLEGYVTVGCSGNETKGTAFSYTIESINGVPAADFISAE
ncbi:MAG: hypothetical protein IJT91_07975 [Clostridia bacterium]|nr:hypothetical protein [Clostridia bacterium]